MISANLMHDALNALEIRPNAFKLLTKFDILRIAALLGKDITENQARN